MSKRSTRTRNRGNPQETGYRLLGACQTCSGCRRPPCHLCVYCRGLNPTTYQRKCLFRLCLHFSYTEQTKTKLALAAQRSFQSLSMGDRPSDDTSNHQDNVNNSPEAQRFLKQCQTILLRTHRVPVECKKWQFDSSWRVWVHKRQQWGIAQRVSSDPPRYDIQLLSPSSKLPNSNISIINSNYSIPPPPQILRRSGSENATSGGTKNASMLTNVPPYLFELDCHIRYLERKKQPSSAVRTIPQIGQPFLHAWRRSSGDIIQIKGEWTGEHREDTQQYKIKVNYATMQPIRLSNDEHEEGQKTTESLPLSSLWVTFDDLQAGYFCAMASNSKVPIADTRDSSPFFIQYKVPRMQFNVQQKSLLPRVSFVYDDRFPIELQVLPSKQAPDAGYGLFACVNAVDNGNNDGGNAPTTVEIPPGVLIDLGVYGPLRPEDRKPWSARLMKSFIFSYHCGSWFFETSKEDDAVFDMTDDATGQLHELARRNVLMYANETSGLEQDIQSLWPIYDPEGAVHFYLGHPDPDQGPLVLPIGTPVELLVDYGPQYEQERVRKNYPRVTGNHLDHIKECLAEEDQAILQDLQELSLEEMESDAIPFLKSLVQEWEVMINVRRQACKPQLLERALIVTMILIHNHCGKKSLSEGELATLRTILSNLCSLFASDQQMKSYMTSNVAYQDLLRLILGDYDWNNVPALLFRRAIVAL